MLRRRRRQSLGSNFKFKRKQRGCSKLKKPDVTKIRLFRVPKPPIVSQTLQVLERVKAEPRLLLRDRPYDLHKEAFSRSITINHTRYRSETHEIHENNVHTTRVRMYAHAGVDSNKE